MSVIWDEGNAAHLLGRTGFNPTTQQIKTATKIGMQKAVAQLLKPPKINDKLPPSAKSIEDLQAWWVQGMIQTKAPLVERLCLFWHNHFATGYTKVANISYMHRQNQIFRKYGMAKFRDLVTEVSKDPAMLIWLDNNTNVKGKQNQNFARELMELFTTGVLDKNGNANYTEKDVDESARAFTGWRVKDDAFFFSENKHDFGSKVFKGHTGNFDGMDIINFLVVDDAAARRICAKLFGYFARDVALNDPIVDELSAVYLANDTDLKPVLERLFTMDAFYSAESKDANIKEPAVFFVTAMRAVKTKLQMEIVDKNSKKKVSNTSALRDNLELCGQSLFDPPTVFGWKGGLEWVTAAGMLSRARSAEWMADARSKENLLQINPAALLGPAYKKISADTAAQRILVNLGIHSPSAGTISAIATYLAAKDNGQPGELQFDPDTIDKKVRGALAIIASSGEFQKN